MPETLDDWLAKLERRHFKAIDMGLERCGRVFENLQSPVPADRVFSIAGTNGKGSVAAYISSIVQAAGLSCGTYTSPHILHFNERIRINGEPASDREIVRAFEAVEVALADTSLTYFEFSTLAALQHMQGLALDVAVLEVGLGGRLDAVNLVNADCAVITPIGLDHQEYLGDDREQIGFEKAGIIRAGQPVILGDRHPPNSVIRHARKLAASIRTLGVDFDVERRDRGVVYHLGSRVLQFGAPPLPGMHQADNLAVALAAVDAVLPDLTSCPERLANGIAATVLAGRLQRHPADPRVLLDVGHNPMAAAAVAAYLESSRAGRRLCVLGMLADKDAEGVAEKLAGPVDEWLCGGLEGARGQGGEDLARRIAARLTGQPVRGHATIADALGSALASAGPADTVLVFGSFETVAAALNCLESGQGTRLAITDRIPTAGTGLDDG